MIIAILIGVLIVSTFAIALYFEIKSNKEINESLKN